MVKIFLLDEVDGFVYLLTKRIIAFQKTTEVDQPTISDLDVENNDLMYMYEMKQFMWCKCEHLYMQNKRWLWEFSLFRRIKSPDDFAKHDDARNIMWLFKIVKQLSVEIEDNNELVSSLDAAKRIFYVPETIGSTMLTWIGSKSIEQQ